MIWIDMSYSSTLLLISLLNALLYFSVVAIAIYIVLKTNKAIGKLSLTAMALLGISAALRMLVPLDPMGGFIIRSERILPALQLTLRNEPFAAGLSVGDFIVMAWIFVALCFAVGYALAMRKAKWVEESFITVPNPKAELCAQKLGCRYEIRTSPCVSTPYTSGIRKPVIFLPSLDFTESELDMVLRHELQHIVSRDNLKKLVLLAIQVVFWWNPLCYLLRKEFDQIIELSCDARVTANCSEAKRLEYAGLLLSVMQKIGSREQKHVLISHMGSSQYRTKQRFGSILLPASAPKPVRKMALCIVIFAMFVGSYFVKIQPYGAPPDMDITDAVAYEGADLHVEEIDGVFYICQNGEIVAPMPDQ